METHSQTRSRKVIVTDTPVLIVLLVQYVHTRDSTVQNDYLSNM